MREPAFQDYYPDDVAHCPALAALAGDAMIAWTDENGLTSNLFFESGT